MSTSALTPDIKLSQCLSINVVKFYDSDSVVLFYFNVDDCPVSKYGSKKFSTLSFLSRSYVHLLTEWKVIRMIDNASNSKHTFQIIHIG